MPVVRTVTTRGNAVSKPLDGVRVLEVAAWTAQSRIQLLAAKLKMGETDELLAEKTKIALANGLKPIFCCGELLEQRQNEDFIAIVKAQITAALFDLSAEDFGKVVIAYEPVWAIGTGKTATPAQAQEAHLFIRKTVAGLFGEGAAAGIRRGTPGRSPTKLPRWKLRS